MIPTSCHSGHLLEKQRECFQGPGSWTFMPCVVSPVCSYAPGPAVGSVALVCSTTVARSHALQALCCRRGRPLKGVTY